MADYDVSPLIGFQLPIKGNGVQFDQNVIRNNFSKADTAFAADRGRLASLESTGVPQAGSDGDRDQKVPNPIQGSRVYRTDKFYTEMYYAAWNATTNPYGARFPGWYPHNTNPTFTSWRDGFGTNGSATPVNVITSGQRWATDSGFGVPVFNGNQWLKLPFVGMWAVTFVVAWETPNTGGQRNAIVDISANMEQLGPLQTDFVGSIANVTPLIQIVETRVFCTAADKDAGNSNSAVRPSVVQNSGSSLNMRPMFVARWVGPGTPTQQIP